MRCSGILKNGLVHLLDKNEECIALLNGYGYGKGTISRNAPDFKVRKAQGLTRATTGDPFAVPRRIGFSGTQTVSIGNLSLELSQTDINTSETLEEYQFGIEEALYLAEHLKAISIWSPDSQSALSSLEILETFEKQDYSFLFRYYGAYPFEINPKYGLLPIFTNFSFLVYKHFRINDWIVKLGTKTGVDFLLYPLGGPQLAHAQYGVSIRTSGNFSLGDTHVISWSASARVLDSIAKSLLIAVVTPAPDYRTQARKVDFFAFFDWSLQTVVLTRWQSTESTKTS